MLRRQNVFDEMLDMFRNFEDLRKGVAEFRPFPVDLNLPRRLPVAALTTAEYLPAVESFIRDKQLVLKAELPGVTPDQVEISVVGDLLTIKGEKKEERKVEKKDYFFREIASGSFERTFRLPEGVRTDLIKAAFTNGILEITMPAAAIETARKVPIEAGEPGKKTVVKAA